MKYKKKYRELKADYFKLQSAYDSLLLDNIDKDIMLESLRSRKAGLAIIDDSIKNCNDKEDVKKLELLRKITILDASYSNYVVKTKSGRICVDTSQIPRTSKEMKSMLGIKEDE